MACLSRWVIECPRRLHDAKVHYSHAPRALVGIDARGRHEYA